MARQAKSSTSEGQIEPCKKDRHSLKERFLVALREEGTVLTAAKVAGVDRKTVYRWRDADPVFAEAWEEAEDAATQLLEQKAWAIAKGEAKPVSNSQLTALIFLLKARRPDVYRDSAPIGGTGGVTLIFNDFVPGSGQVVLSGPVVPNIRQEA